MTKVHLIGNAHIDPVWLWRWQDGFAEVKATFRSALDRMKEFPEYVFTCACASYYKWVEENEPVMFEEIRQRIKEGRWVLTGGWWLQPDCNLPSGESFARHALYSQLYFLEKFGKIARTGYNVDSFGHNAMLPQILKKSGMDQYVMMRPQAHEKELPSCVFWWEGPEGSRVLTYRIPYEYVTRCGKEGHIGKVDAVTSLSDEQGVPLMLFYGVGNHGGGPTIEALRTMEELRAERGTDTLDYSCPDKYFHELRSSGLVFPIVKDELQHHASGCYSAMSEIKANNRKAECRLVNAEKMMTIANHLLGLEYRNTDIQKAWESVMFNQFHDILGGCCIQEAYDDARDFHGRSLALAGELLNAAVQKLSWAIDTCEGKEVYTSKDYDDILWEQELGGAPIVVFNPLPWDVQAHIQIPRRVKGLTDESGTSLTLQNVRAPQTNGEDIWDSLFTAIIPSLGYRVFRAYMIKEFVTPVDDHILIAEKYALENDWLRLEIDPDTGFISNLVDKMNGAKVFARPGAVPIVIDDSKSDTWAHGIFEFRNEVGVFTNASVRLIEQGPLRAILRVASSYGRSSLRQDFILYRNKQSIEVNVKLDWQEKHMILKLSFPVNVMNAKPVYEIPYGAFERKADGKEYPGQAWVDISGSLDDGTQYGLALANTAKYSYDVLDSDLRMTVARSAMFADHYGMRDDFAEYIDQGVQYFKYILRPHTGGWQQSGIVRSSMELLNPTITVLETYHKGSLPLSCSFLKIDIENIAVSALKRAEDGHGVILRCVELYGKEAIAELDLCFLGVKWRAEFGPFEIKTFHIREDGYIKEVNILEQDWL